MDLFTFSFDILMAVREAVAVLACNIWEGGFGPMASTVARAYNGGLGAELPARSRGRAPGQVVGAKLPLIEAEALFVFRHSMEVTNLPTFLKLGNTKKS